MPKEKIKMLNSRDVCKLLYSQILSAEGEWACVKQIESAETEKGKVKALAKFVSVRDFEWSSTLSDAKKLLALTKWLGLTLPKGIMLPNGWAKHIK